MMQLLQRAGNHVNRVMHYDMRSTLYATRKTLHAMRYTLHATRAQAGDRRETLIDTWVHNSRVWRTDGMVLTERVRQQNDGWGDSVLEVCKDQLSNRSSVMKSARVRNLVAALS